MLLRARPLLGGPVLRIDGNVEELRTQIPAMLSSSSAACTSRRTISACSSSDQRSGSPWCEPLFRQPAIAPAPASAIRYGFDGVVLRRPRRRLLPVLGNAIRRARVPAGVVVHREHVGEVDVAVLLWLVRRPRQQPPGAPRAHRGGEAAERRLGRRRRRVGLVGQAVDEDRRVVERRRDHRVQRRQRPSSHRELPRLSTGTPQPMISSHTRRPSASAASSSRASCG